MSYHSIECCENLDKKLQNSLTKNWDSWGKIAFTQSSSFCEWQFLKMQLNAGSHQVPKVDGGSSKHHLGGGSAIFALRPKTEKKKDQILLRGTRSRSGEKNPIDRIVSRCCQDWSPPKMSLSPNCRGYQSASSRRLIMQQRTHSNVKQRHELTLILTSFTTLASLAFIMRYLLSFVTKHVFTGMRRCKVKKGETCITSGVGTGGLGRSEKYKRRFRTLSQHWFQNSFQNDDQMLLN